MSRLTFGIAVGVLMAMLALGAGWLRGDAAKTVRMQRLFLTTVAAVFCWHIGISLWTESLQPGVITSVLFLPAYLWLLRRLPRAAQ